MTFNTLLLLVLILNFHLIAGQVTNLPDVPPGVFTAGTRLEINSTTTAAWNALTDFPAYAEWNPFVRKAIVLSPLNITLPDQYPMQGKNLYLRNQIPPLPLPVNKYTPDNPFAIQFAYEIITHVDKGLGRLAWKYYAEDLLQAERWQAISDLGDGMMLYESREVFSGPLAETLKAIMGEGLQQGFDAQGQGLKLLLEGSQTTL